MPKTMTAIPVYSPGLTNLQLLTLVGVTCYGDFWQKHMAKHVGLSQRHMVRWCKGQWPVPDLLQDGRHLVVVLKEVLDQHQGKVDLAQRRVIAALPFGGRPGT
jgi:hypothetical protein